MGGITTELAPGVVVVVVVPAPGVDGVRLSELGIAAFEVNVGVVFAGAAAGAMALEDDPIN
jgi:hypothetical protein